MLELKLTQEIQGELNACHLFIKRRTYEDAIGPLTNIEKRVKDAMDHAAAEEDTRYALHKAIWGVLCGAKAEPKKKTSTAKHTEAPYTLLQCIQDVREKVSVSDDEAEGKVLKSSCTLLQTVLEWLSLRGLSRAQVLYVKEVAWKTFVTLSQMDKRSGTQGTCLAVLLYLVSHTAGPGHHWMTLTAEQLKAAEMMPHCLTLCDKRNASITGAKSFALQLLGAISLSFATSASVSAHFPTVFQTFLRTAERLQQSLNQTVGEGFFLGLCDFLKVYVLDFSNEAHKKHIIDLHQMVLNAFADACRAHNVANYKFCKAAMIFFQAHAEGALVECVVQDAQRYFGLLGDLWVHKNVDLHRCAYYAAATFFRAVGRHLASSNRPASVELLQYLMNELEAVLRDTQCSRQRLMFSVVAYGYMARPLAYLLGQEAVRRFFSQLAGRSDTLLSSFSSNREDAVRLMPQLLNAFAYFLYEMESISTVELDTIRTLLERTVEVYASDYFFEKIRAVTAPALMRLFTALQRHVASTSMVALFCAKLLQAVTGSGGASTTFPLELDEDDDAEEEGPEAVPAASRRPDRNGIAYGRVKTYAVFAQRLLCEESLLKESGWDYLWSVSEVRKAVEQVREELHLASLTLILQLDVSVQPSARGVEDVDQTPAVVALSSVLGAQEGEFTPTSEESYEYFLNFVEFYAEVAPNIWGSNTQEEHTEGSSAHWLYEWMAAVVDRSFLYGYVSGFFRLLYVTLSSVSGAVVRQEESLLILLARHLQSCHYRIHLYSGELLYQCSVFVVVASQFVPSGKVSHDCLRIAFQEVFSAEVGAEELFRKAVVEGNKKLAVDALEALMRTQLEWTCTFVPLLLNARLMRQKTTVARRLAVLASRHGVDIANTISRQEKRLKAGGILVTKQSSFSHWEARKPDNRIALSFGGISLNFPLYNLLDKVIHLCLHGEEKVAVTAAELFHFIVIWSIGKGKQYSWFDKLFPTVVILASRTSINITQELFHDLLIQSSHYFATTEHGEYFTNALFEKLQDKEAAIRRVSGVALVEYLSWASTTTSAEQRINQVLQRLGALFLLDSVWARIGGSSMVHLTLRAYVEGRFKCGLQDLVSLLKTVLRCLEVAAEATPQDELGIMEELLGAVRHFRRIFRKEKNLTDVGAKERAALGQQLLHCSVFIATLSSHSTNDVLTLLEQIVCGGAENTSPAMAEWVKTNMDLIEREFFPDATPDIGGMHNVLVVYTCFQQRGWLGHRDPTGVKRAREVESTPQLLQLFKTMVTRTANVIAREVDSTEYKESIAMQVFPADVSRLCTALSHFLTTCASSEAEGTVVQEELLTDTFFSFVAQQVVFESPSPLSTRNKVLPTGVERSGHLLRTLQVLLSRLAEGPQSVTVKEMGKKLVCALGKVLPPFLWNPSGSEAASVVLSNPAAAYRRLVTLVPLVDLPSLERTDGSLWADVVSAAPSIIKEEVWQEVISGLLWKGTSDVYVSRLTQVLLPLLFGLPKSQFSLAYLLGQLESGNNKKRNVKNPKKKSSKIEDDSDEEKEEEKREKRLQDKYNQRLDLFFVSFSTSLKSVAPSKISQLLKETCDNVEKEVRAALDGDTGDSDLLGGNTSLQALEGSVSSRALQATLKALLNQKVDQEVRQTLVHCLSSIVHRDALAVDFVDAFLLKIIHAFLLVDRVAILQSPELTATITHLLTQSCSPSQWEGRNHTLLASKRATYFFILSMRALQSALVLTDETTSVRPAMQQLATTAAALLQSTVNDELPLDWKELQSETTEHDNYFKVVNSIITAAKGILPLCPSTLTTLLPLLGMTDHPLSDRLGSTVEGVMQNMEESERLRLCVTCVELQKSPLPPQVWWAATYRICLPVIRSLTHDTRVQFLSEHVRDWVSFVSADTTGVDQQINAFVLLETMYRIVDSTTLKTTINSAFTGKAQSEGKELTVKLIQICSKARYAKPNEEREEKIISLRQAAYRCLATLLMATQDQEPVFVSLLLSRAKNANGLNLIVNKTWLENCETLPLATDAPTVPEESAKDRSDWELRYRHRAPDVKDPIVEDEENMAAEWMYDIFQTQNRSVLTLKSSTVAGGLSQMTLPPTRAASSTNAVELDGVWNSTCTGTLLSLVDFLIHKFGTAGDTVPNWVKEMANILQSDTDHIAVKLVFSRLIQLRSNFFDQFANLVGEKILSVVTQPALGNEVHYVARETIVMLLEWAKEGQWEMTSSAGYRGLLFLLHNGANLTSNSPQYVRKHNVELFRAMYAQVKSLVTVSAAELIAIIDRTAEGNGQGDYACQICGVLTDQGTLLASTGSLEEVQQLYTYSVGLIKAQSPVSLAAAEVVAMELELLSQTGKEQTQRKDLEKGLSASVVKCITEMKSEDYALKVMRILVSRYVLLLSEFPPVRLFANYANLSSEKQILIMDIIGTAPDLGERYYTALHTQFSGTLENYADSVMVYLYELLAKIIPQLGKESLSQLRGAFLNERAYDTWADSGDCRGALVKCAIRFLQNESPEDKQSPENQLLRQMLLQKGLTDDYLFVQDKVLEFADLECLRDSFTDRVTSLLTDAGFNQNSRYWPRHVSILLLSIAAKDGSFKTSLFSSPLLNEVVFTPKVFSHGASFTGSATAAGRQHFAPLFSLQTHTAMGDVGTVHNYYPSASQANPKNGGVMPPPSVPPHTVRQAPRVITSSLVAPAETAQFTFHTANPSFAPSLASRLTFTRKTTRDEAGAGEGPFLRKKLRVEAPEQSLMAHSARQKKSKLERKRVDSEMEKRRTVIFRHYKEGDVPDVQVTLQAFVSPLQALCLHDTEFASLVAATLLSSSFEWIETQKTGKTADHKETQDSVTASYMGGSMVDSVWLESSLLDSLATYTTTQLSSIRALDPAVLPLTLEYVLLYSVKSGGTVSVKELSDVSSSGSSPLLATALVDLLNGKGASQMTFSEWFSLAGALDRLDSELTLEAVRHCLQPETISTLASAKLAARSGSLHYAEECLARWGDTHARSSLEKEYGSEENGREVHRFMEEERRRATAALLKWPSVWESVQTEQSSPLYMPALLHCHVKERENGERFDLAADNHPFESCGLLLKDGKWAEAADRAEGFIQHLLAERNGDRTVGEGASCQRYQLAYRLSCVVQSSELLQRVANEVPGALTNVREVLQSTTSYACNVTSARLLDDVLWVHRTLESEMMKTNKPNIPDDVVAHLGEWFASSELALTVSPMGHLLGSPASHGGLKELLLRTRDNIKPYLRQEEGAMLQLLSVTARERMFSILFNVPWGAASAGAMEQVLTDISPYMGKMDAATVRQIRSDYAYCCVSLNLHTSSSDSETVYRDHEALLTELADIAKDSAPATVVYLGLLDRFLTQGVDEESVWLAYATTLLSALQVYGNATFIPGTEDRDGVIPMYCIPHLLQLFAFDFSKKAAFATSAEWAPVVEGLLRLPSSIWAPWTSQIITSVLQCQHVVVAKVLLQLAQQQPQTVFYPYNCAMGEFHQLSQQGDPTLRPVVEELYRVLQEEARLDRLRGFVRELCRVSHPLQLLRLFMERIQLNFASFIKTGEEAFYQLAVKDLEEGRRTIGKSGCCETEKISWGEAQRIEELFEGLVDANSKSLSRDKTVVWGQLKKMHAAIQSKPRERPRALVTDYTAKLPSLLFPASSSPTEGLRLPCQPLLQLNQPDTDVHLIGVHPHMDVMSSLQAPRRLTFYTTQQSYDVLLKCNEDMRLDQRIQDVFFICSSLLQRGSGTTSTSLYLRTYSVVPLTDKVGLIQWVPHTTTFNDLINTVMQHRTGARLNMELPVMKEYVQRYYRAVDSKRVLLSYTKDPNGADGHYAKWFEGIVKQVDSTYLTAALTQIAEQRADHYRIQKHFVETYATLSLVSYLFGVGDRHLSNFLSDHKSGEVISIDFGHAFGTATTTLPVPELVPFRLTPQIQAVQGVMGGGVSALHMTTVLRTLRRYRSSLEGITSSFTSEPLLQWKAANISPDQMMASITRKLNLENPCTLMYELAKHNTFMRDAKQLPGIKEALYNGRSEARSVSEKSQQCESEENFVECLIDMATDYNLIGRIYHGWMPMF